MVQKRWLWKPVAVAVTVGVLGFAYQIGPESDKEVVAPEVASTLERPLTEPKDNQVVAPARTIGDIVHSERSSFLTKLVADENIPFCDGVVYDPTGDKLIASLRTDLQSMNTAEKTIETLLRPYEKEFGDGNYRVKTPDVFDLSGQGRSSKIFVGRELFEEFPHYTNEDLRCIVAIHGRHVHQHAKGLEHLDKETIVQAVRDGRIHYPVLKEIMALDANYHALKRVQAGEFKLSPTFSKDIRKTYDKNLSRLRSIAHRLSPLQQGLVQHYLDKVKDLP